MTTVDIDLDDLADVLREAFSTGEFSPVGFLASSLDNIADAIRMHAAAVLAASFPIPDELRLREDRTDYRGDAMYEMLEQFHRPSIKNQPRL